MEETSKGGVNRFWEEVFNQGRLDVVDEIFASNFELHDPAADPDGEVRGPEGMKGLVRRIRSAFPDVRTTVEAQMTTESGRVTTLFTVSVTRGIPGSG
ncbi:MAG: ester cyclase [Rubrobacter sp.]|nr:ester cyclase [Rubrobacter sp.]